jgi:hypothetical protein
MKRVGTPLKQNGFTILELLLACFIFPIIVIGISNAFDSVRKSYTTARELNEIYAVLSACPEIDRALEFNALTSAANCFPNNTFESEGAGTTTLTYAPNLTVTNTAGLPLTDPLQTVTDSKVVDIDVGFLKSSAPPLRLRMLVTRNGIGQQ